MAPIELPVRRRNWAIERLALVTIGFWPVMSAQVADGRVERLGIGQGLAQADVDDDLREPRDLLRVAVFELLLERRHDLGRVALLESAGHAFTSSCSPQWRQTRTRRPLSSVACPMRVGLSQLRADEHDLADRASAGRCPGCRPAGSWACGRSCSSVWRGLVWRLAMLRPSTTTDDATGRASRAGTCSGRRARRARRIDALDRAALAGVLAGEHDDGVALADLGHLRARTGAVRAAITAPPGRATRSSCSCGRAARARPGRRCACRAGCPGC